MKRSSQLAVAAVFVFFLALGTLQGQRVRHLRESEAFYRWVLAAATNMRLQWDDSGDYADDELFEEVNLACAAYLPQVEQPQENLDSGRVVNELSLVAGDDTNDKLIWDLARGRELAPARTRFLSYAREQKLLYAQNIAYAEAQASGVNVFNLFFGFRKVAANFVWLQVDRYWHKGMVYRMVPMMKTVVTLDPNFVDAYLVGAWHLAYNVTAKMPATPAPDLEWSPKFKACVGEKETYFYVAIDYLKDGIRKNPRDYRIYFDLGFSVYKNKMKDYGNAVKYLREAIRQPHDRWVPRQLAICQELNGEYETARAGWLDYQKRFPETATGDEVAPRFIKRNEGLLWEKRMAEAQEKAKAAATPQKAAEFEAEADECKRKALDIWESMTEPFADSRRMRLMAMELLEEERHLEALAMLDKARWESSGFFDEASNLMIEIKQEAGMSLSVSEKKAVLRNQEGGERCAGMPEAEAK